jgi:hypothetical protein
LSTGGKAEQAQERSDGRQSATAYRSIRVQLEYIAWTEARWDKEARKRTGVTQPARLYARHGQPPSEHPPEFHAAMQRLWDIGSLPEGRADMELRRPYHLIAKGKVPVTEADVIALGQMTDAQLRLLLPWLAHRLSLADQWTGSFRENSHRRLSWRNKWEQNDRHRPGGGRSGRCFV